MSVPQKDVRLSEPIPENAPETISAEYITPNLCESVLNLQMDYILNKKALLSKHLFNHPITLSVNGILAAYLFNKKFVPYLSDYNKRQGYLKLLKNSYFIDDLISFISILIFSFCFSYLFLWLETRFLADESKSVPENTDKYFGLDLMKYSNINKNRSKLSGTERELISKMEENSYIINYREVPIAFIVIERTQTESENVIKVTGLGIRRVYIKSEILTDLINWLKKQMVTEKKLTRCLIDVHSFEKFDQKLLKKAGFKTISKKPAGGLLIKYVTTLDTLELIFDPEV